MATDDNKQKIIDELDKIVESELREEKSLRKDQRDIFDKFRTGVDQKKIIVVKKQINDL